MSRWRRCSRGSGGDQVGHDGVGELVGDGSMRWQIRLLAASDVVVGEQGGPSCARREETAVML